MSLNVDMRGDALTVDAITLSGTESVAGVFTPTGGIAAAGGFTASPRNWHTGATSAQVSTDFTDKTAVTTETYYAEVFVPCNATLTGVAIMNGSSVAGNMTAFLTNGAGTNLAHTASTAVSGTDAYQLVPFSATYSVKGPATYYVALQCNNTGNKFNTHTIGTFGTGKDTTTTYGTFPTATIPTTFTTNLGPVASLY